MRLGSDVQRIIAYQSWSRGKYLDLYDRLPWETLVRNREASFGSIRNVHLHVLEAYSWWLVNVFDRKSLVPVLGLVGEGNFDRVTSVRRLRELDRKIDRELLAVGHALTPARLRRKHQVTWDNERAVFTEREAIWHILEEDYLHRGEIICMLWQDDIEPPYTGYMWWEYETDPKGHQYLFYRTAKGKPTPGGRVRS
jgi:uncharacterized damage-inducible protein DinB